MTTKYEKAEQEMLEHKFEPTGQWEVRSLYCSNYEGNRPVLVAPDGSVHRIWPLGPSGAFEAEGYALTYNMNDDKAAEFRQCPYCWDECSWCCK